MSTVLVLMAHPSPSRSRHNRAMFERASALDGAEAVDLYATYPRFRIDVAAEQARLLAHDAVVLQFPFFWYSVPALLKEYLDRVLEYGFAYGQDGDRLQGKRLLAALTTGGSEHAYSSEGHNRYPIETLLTPLEQSAHLCGLIWQPPLVLHAANVGQRGADEPARRAAHVERYVERLAALRDATPTARSAA